MIFGLFRRKKSDQTIPSLYGAIVAQARQPAFYRDHGVPDTVDGRFEMIALHVFLLLHRLKGEPAERRELGQGVFDAFFGDLDRGLRELGVGDTSVPKRIKKMGEAFYGRVKAYDEALASADPAALEAALARNVVGDPAAPAAPLAAYVRRAAAQLAACPYDSLAAGTIAFPAVEGGRP